MSDILITFIIGIIFGGLGFLIGKHIAGLKSNTEATRISEQLLLLEKQLENLQERLQKEDATIEALRKEKEILLINLAEQKVAFENLKLNSDTQQQETEKLQKKFTTEFENLANKILEEKTTKFTIQNKENIATILNPLKEKIDGFEKKVEDTHKESISHHASLKQQILGLKDLNEQMSKEAVNLTKALKGDSKIQGDWGETQLEILLEKANLTKEIHYTTQGGYRDHDGKLKKPDFIINLPDDRHLIIDSKVSLTAYESYANAENTVEKEAHLKKHMESMRKHFKDLSSKKYASLYEINSPDYVLMFVPIEPALMVALNKTNDLYLEALDKNIVLVSTSTLLATLSTIASMWRQENQKKNVLAIAEQAGRLYDQFVNLTEDLIKVGNQLKTVQGSYDSSMKKLTGKGNLVTKVEKIKKLGAKANKSINKNLLDRALGE